MWKLKIYSIHDDITLKAVNISNLHASIESSGCVADFSGITTSEDSITIIGDSILDEAALDILVQNHEVETLAQLKSKKISEIDIKTGELISGGFTFDNEQFSLSLAAQKNWLGLKVLESLVTWPVSVTTITDGEYSLSQANLIPFMGTGQATLQANLNSGRALKIQINQAVDKEAVNAITDGR